MQRKLLAVGAAWALLAVSAGPAVANGDDGGLVGVAQSAANVVTQDASATAETTQLVPVNANVPVAAGSPGAGGDVQQSNDASSAAAAGNVAVVDQSATQDAGGNGGGGGQAAANVVAQDATATAETVQAVPVNVNAPVAEPAPNGTNGKDGCGCEPKPKHDKPANDRQGDVEQSNDASSSAAAGNVAIVEQTIEQTADGDNGHPPVKHDAKQNGRDPGKDRGGESGQSAKNEVDQDADANAKTVQIVPVNANLPVADPGHEPGCGCQPEKGHGKQPGGQPQGGDVEQSNDASSKAGAGNVAIVEQTIDQTATGDNGHPPVKHDGDKGRDPGKDRGSDGQSAKNEVDQDADANAKTVQIVPVNVNAPIAIASPGAGGDVEQSNDASSKAGAGNVAIVGQDVDQTQTGRQGGDKPHGCGCDDKGDKGREHDTGGQSAKNEVDQDADANAKTVQIVPVNVNAPIAIASPGAGGDVNQSNDASSKAGAGNVAIVGQDIDQTQTGRQGGDKPHGCGCDDKGDKGREHDTGGQSAKNEVDQDADANAKTVQIVPVNVNAPIAIASPGAGGDVNQSNDASSKAGAGNVAIVGQDVDQTAGGGDKGRGGPSGDQSARNEVDQDADANAKTVQIVPVNVNAPIAIASPGAGGDVNQSNDASSKAGAGNVAIVGQDVDQTQTGGKGDKPHKPEKPHKGDPGCGCGGNDHGQGGHKPHGNGSQSASNTVDQDANAHAKTVQLVPVNLNAPVAKPKPQPCGCEPRRDDDKGKDKGKGKPYGNRGGGDVTQSNTARSGAWAGNLAIVGQDIDQTAKGGGAQRARNEVDQDANARAKTVQFLPINANLPSSGGAAPAPAPLVVPDDPGCGCQGPGGPPWHGPGGGDVDQSNTASSWAGALNVAFVDQAITQAAGGRR